MALFATAENLNRMTPKDMRFEITSELSLEMHEGQNIPVKWVNEITHIREKSYFVDEQDG